MSHNATTHRSWIVWAGTVFLALVSFGFLVPDDSDLLLRIHRGITTFGKVYEEIAVNYVDAVDPDTFMRAGIDGMLHTLDPYTTYIGERENDEIDLVTTGRYGGVGVSIGLRDGVVTVINLLEGFSAAKQGVQVGDRIMEIDAHPTKGLTLEAVRQLVRGAPGSELRMKVEREAEKEWLEFVLLREEIPVRNVTYSGMVDNGIAYVRLERFSRTAGEDLRNALVELHGAGSLKGVVLDLRDNPGGLLDIAVDIVAKFVPESSLVVSTRGRRSDAERRYFSSETPLLPEVPLAVLVNRSSASASEIVAGALQDMDRGVLVGTRTFGKGLVQTITRLSENASLKMTTARYYTPSGRCIQELDYWHRDDNGDETTIPDSLRKEFRTSNKRQVWEAGGITPDTTVADTVRIPYLDALVRNAMFFKYANHYATEHKTIPENFEVTDAMIEDFETYIKDKGFDYQEEGELKIADLRRIASSSRYAKDFTSHLDQMETIVRSEKQRQIHRFHDEVRLALQEEILGRFKGDRARFEASFHADRQLQTAISILKNKKAYRTLLAGK